MLNVYLSILHIQVYTYGIFALLAIMLSSYVIWREARKEGFDEEQIFDMILVVLLGSVFIGRLIYALSSLHSIKDIFLHVVMFWTLGIDITGMVVGALVVGFMWCRHNKWSLYRIMDIFAMGFSLGIPVFLLSFVFIKGRYDFLVAFGILVFVHLLVRKLRSRGVVFGSLFGVFLMTYAAFIALLFPDKKSLIFYSFLFTLGLVVLVYRVRSKKVKIATPISKEFLKNVRDFLTKKDKELAKEELLLKKEDEYGGKNRDISNVEDADGAVSEAEHEKTDIITRSIEDMRIQIKKALAKINIGTYGICDMCHKPIDAARLKAFPQATTCMVCAEKESEIVVK